MWCRLPVCRRQRTHARGAPSSAAPTPAQTLRLQSSFAGLRYEIACTATKGDRTTSAAGFLLVRSVAALPTIRLDGLPAGSRLSPTAQLTLGATVDSVAPDQLQLLWTQKSGPPVDLSNPAVAATPVTSPSLVILPGALQPGKSYVFLLNATDPVGTALAEVAVAVATAPHGVRGAALGSVSAVVAGGVGGSSAEGVAFATVFTLSASGWADEDGPLLYQFQYIMNAPGSAAAAADAPGAVPALPVVLAPFQPLDTLSGVTFPAGHEAAERSITVQLCAARRRALRRSAVMLVLRVLLRF